MRLSEHTQGRPYAKHASRIFTLLCGGATWLCVFILLLLLWNVFSFGWNSLSWDGER